ncbi:hypothetical protein KU6B_29090 [Mameliella alba]|nr:hypothetical protein KU6B_29090 [Mameliella alba]
MIETVNVPLPGREYEVRIGAGLLSRAGAEIAPLLKRPRVAIVSDENVAASHLATLEAALAAGGIESVALTLPPGESTKGWPQFTRTVEWLLEQKVERRDIVVALGGGVIGDLVGFAAAVLRRGSVSCRSRPAFWRRSTVRWAARPASTRPRART